MTMEILRTCPSRDLEEALALETFSMRIESFERFQNLLIRYFENGKRGARLSVLMSMKFEGQMWTNLSQSEMLSLFEQIGSLRQELGEFSIPRVVFVGEDGTRFSELIELDNALKPTWVWEGSGMALMLDFDGLISLVDPITGRRSLGRSFVKVPDGYRSDGGEFFETDVDCAEGLIAEVVDGETAIGATIDRLYIVCREAVDAGETLRILWG